MQQDNARLWTFGSIALGVAALALILATWTSTSNAATSEVGATPVPMVERADSVNVTISDGAIDMPDTLSAASATFVVTNDGQQAHGFALSGPVEARLENPVAAGQSESLSVELEPGTYTAFCPMEGHQAEESTEFTVK